jgi:hypothetical protein
MWQRSPRRTRRRCRSGRRTHCSCSTSRTLTKPAPRAGTQLSRARARHRRRAALGDARVGALCRGLRRRRPPLPRRLPACPHVRGARVANVHQLTRGCAASARVRHAGGADDRQLARWRAGPPALVDHAGANRLARVVSWRRAADASVPMLAAVAASASDARAFFSRCQGD